MEGNNMGIRNFDLKTINEVLLGQNLILNGLKMLQLGDQIYREKKVRAKKYFEELGAFVLSIDINGKGGSVSKDLSKHIEWPEYKCHFDMITNFGTSEHVSDHIVCFENMYYFCRKGGIIYSLVPREGFWNHGAHRGVHKYNTEFFAKWANEHSCEVIINRIVTREERACPDMILAVLKK